MPLRTSRRNYNRISAQQDDAVPVDESNALDEPLSPSSSIDEGEHDAPKGRDEPCTISSTEGLSTLPPIYHEINVVLMDAAQTKFNIKCDKQWSVSEFKEASASVTKVGPQMQRLIHMGKLLQDAETLEHYGISEDGKIIHLFPKPNVVINT